MNNPDTGTEAIDTRALLGPAAEMLGPDLVYPAYRQLDSGPWRIAARMSVGMNAYFSGFMPMYGIIVLTGPTEDRGTRAWMSMTPFELESQVVGIRASRGHTVIFGLGMGWAAANAAVRDGVTKVTVVEFDPRIVDLNARMGTFDFLPEEIRAKIEIVQADARTWVPEAPVDVLQIDIWQPLVGTDRVADVRAMTANVLPAEIYFWTQEVEILRLALRRSGGTPSLDWPTLRAIVAEDMDLTGLILPDWPDYPDRIVQGLSRFLPQNDTRWRED